MEDLFGSIKIPELREQLKEVGIIAENQNLFPLFEPTLQPKHEEKVFEGKHGKLIINGRLGQPHKNLLEVILCKKYIYDFIEIENDKHLKALYNEKKIKRYLQEYERYEELIKDMIQTTIELKTDDLRLRRLESLIFGRITIKNFEPPQKISSIIPEKVTLSKIRFGSIATILVENEFKLTYNSNQLTSTRETYHEISKAMEKQVNEAIEQLFMSFKDDKPPITYHKINM